MSPTLLPQTVYRRARAPHELTCDHRLRALEWALYFAVTGTHTAAELGEQMRAGAAQRDDALARLIRLGLIEEQDLDAAGYVRALAAAGDPEEKTLRQFLIGATAPTGPSTLDGPETPRLPGPVRSDAKPPAAVSPLSAPVSRAQLREVPVLMAPSRRTTLMQGLVTRPVPGFEPLPRPGQTTEEDRAMPASRRLSLRAVMDLIQNQAGNDEAGQLNIYRVFVRVNTLLLKKNGIQTLRFTEDRLISDPELEQAIVSSVKKTLGLDCPESVWVEVA